MTTYALLPGGEDENEHGDPLLEQRDKWQHVKNLDQFFQRMYQYYISKGVGAIILSQLCSVCSLGFTIVFSAFLLGFVDWNGLLDCHDEDSCNEVDIFINPFHKTPTRMGYFIFLYFVLFSAFWVWQCITAVNVVSDALEMASFYSDTLGCSIN